MTQRIAVLRETLSALGQASRLASTHAAVATLFPLEPTAFEARPNPSESAWMPMRSVTPAARMLFPKMRALVPPRENPNTVS